LATLFDVSVALADGEFPLGGAERTQEIALGDLVADAFLAKYAPAGAQIAVMNGAGIRDTLPSTYTPTDHTLRRPAAGYQPGPPFDIVVGDVYTILPFRNLCSLHTITAATLWQMLEQSVIKDPAPNNGYLQIAGFKFAYQPAAPAGARVQSVTLDDGTDLKRADTRSIVLVDTDFLETGGDGYGMLVGPNLPDVRDDVADVLLAYLKSTSPFVPTVKGRIARLQ
jgi:5'-nucleotidase